ncbi:MAG: sugar transferase [Actinomycetota bacterium]
MLLRRVLAGADWAGAMAGLLAAYTLSGPMQPASLYWGIVFSPLWILVAKLHGLYDIDHRRIRHSTLDELPGLMSTSVFGTLALAGLIALSPAAAIDSADGLILGAVAFSVGVMARVAVRYAFRTLGSREIGLIVGSGTEAAALARKLAVHPETRLVAIGYLDDGSTASADAGGPSELPWLGSVSDMVPVAAAHGAERVLIADNDLTTAQVREVITDCKRCALGLTMVAPHASMLGPGTELNRLGELPLLDFRFADASRSTLMMKRLLDLVLASTLLVLLAPLMLVVALLIKLGSRGPVFFRQVRIGAHGKPFSMWKFRSMVSDAEKRLPAVVDLGTLSEPAFKVRGDPRATRVGRVLRRLSLDELPQLINVLLGHMSMVGPRPEEEAVVRLYDERQRMRLAVKPGITGPMQVYGRGDLSFEERLALERDYLDHLSIAGDLKILLRTPVAIARGNGAY